MPERFQLRQVPVKPTEEGEIEEESEWIYKQAFSTPPISQQVGGSKSLWALVIVKTPIWFNVFNGILKIFFIHLFRAVPEINTWGGREAPLKFTNHP